MLSFGTDGSCLRNPDGPTGWAYISRDGAYSFGGRVSGTNQIGELMAVLTVLRDFPDEVLEIQSDSAYAIGCCAAWKAGWQRAGYRRKSGPLANLGLIREIHTLIDNRDAAVMFVKVRAHLRDETVHPLNVRADELAGRGARAAQIAGADVVEYGRWPLSSVAPVASEPQSVPSIPGQAAPPPNAAVLSPTAMPDDERMHTGYLF